MSQRLLQSICGFPGKEKAAKAAEKAAAKDHFLSSFFVYFHQVCLSHLCICVFVSSVFVYLWISRCRKKAEAEQLSIRLLPKITSCQVEATVLLVSCSSVKFES